VIDLLSQRSVPDVLWALVEPLILPGKVRLQGGGRSRTDPRAVFTAIVSVPTSGCAWRHLPPSFGVTVPTAHRTFTEWTQAGLWRRLHRAVLDEPADLLWAASTSISPETASTIPSARLCWLAC
jgi:transposase